MSRSSFLVLPLVALLGLSESGAADPKFEVVLKTAFINKYKDLTSIKADMTVRHSHPSPNPVGEGSADGDLHFSGVSEDIGLPFVAEVVNAAQESPAVDFIKQSVAHSIPVLGAWRVWFEHPSIRQVQGGTNPFKPDTTNPDHSFEIHPIAAVGQVDVHDSYVPVHNMKVHPPKDFVAYTPDVAFKFFDGIDILVKASQSGVSIRSKKLKYNYVQFFMELTQKPKKVADGFIALAQVQDEEGDPQSDQERRMIFVEGTEGAHTMSGAGVGDRFHVLGVPRLNLNALAFLVDKNGTTQFSAKMPYEMIIVGIYPD